MPNYYNKTNFERKDISQETIDLWTETINPKLEEYALTPAKPADNATWGPGYWIIPPTPTYTANAWLEKEGYGPTQLITLLDLQGKLIAAGKASQKLKSVRDWTDGILASFVQDESPRSDWGSAPFAFSETVIDAFQQLN
jgi:hypothetical protein